MTNLEYMRKLLTEDDPFDDGGASWEAMVHYNINCPYFAGDERAKCRGDHTKPCRELCVDCKIEWLNAEVDP